MQAVTFDDMEPGAATVQEHRAGPLIVELTTDPAEAEAAWASLEKLPFTSLHQSRGWCRAWLACQETKPLLVVCRRGGEVRLVLPLEIVRIAGRRVARYIGSPFSNINFGLHAADIAAAEAEEIIRALRAELLRSRSGIDLALLDKMPVQWRGVDNPLFALPHTRSQNSTFQVSLHPHFDAVLAQVNGKRRRKKFRHVQRRLEEMGGYRLEHADNPASAAELLETFFDQKSRRFEKQGRLDVFRSAEVRTFLHRLAQESVSGQGTLLRLSAIRLNDGRIGAVAGYSYKDGHTICQIASIDEAIAEQMSIGEFLFHHLISEACGPDAVYFDLGIGEEIYKHSWCDRQTEHFTFFLPLTPAGHLLASALRLVVAAKRKVKSNARLARIARILLLNVTRG